jgi:hypothetical protein
MSLNVRRSTFIEYLIVVALLSLFSALTPVPSFGQHPVRVAPPPMPFPPAVHPPIYRAPIYQPPNYPSPGYAPIYAPHIYSPPANALSTVIFRPPARPIHPLPPALRFYVFPVTIAPVWPANFCWWATCERFWTSSLVYNSPPLNVWNPANFIPLASPEPSLYVFGAERPDIPQLFLKDGTTLFVNDYWVVDDQLHFTIIEDEGMKPAEHVVPFDDLDLQKTIDVNTKRGFRFMLRNEPFEQYIRDHPEGPPASKSPQ